MSELMHWHEGLFLQPHHLQGMQRSFLERFARERRLLFPHPYGLIQARLSPDALENMLVRFDLLNCVMPSGLEVRFPDAADLPALDIKRAFEAGGTFAVSLGVPLYYANRSNAIDPAAADTVGGAAAAPREDWRVKRLYRVAEVERPDENTGDNPQPMLVRRINARLLLDGDDPTDLEVLPLLRVAHAAGQDVGLPRQDPLYVPPCLVMGGSPALLEMVRDLANQVEASRKELALQMTRGGGFSVETMRGVQFEQMLRLGALSRFSARLMPRADVSVQAPFHAYVELRELLAELTALHPEQGPVEVADYDHDNPAIAFRELSDKIRACLHGTVAPSVLKVPFVRAERMLVASLGDEHLSGPNEYFLGIKTKLDPTVLARLVEDADKFKLMARSMANQRIWGIKLTEERHPPLELPAQLGLYFFRLVRADSARMWERVAQEKSLALKWPDLEGSDFEVALYMPVATGA